MVLNKGFISCDRQELGVARAWVILDDLGRMGGAIIRSRRHMDREGNACGRAASSKAGDEQLQLAAGQGEPLGLVDL